MSAGWRHRPTPSSAWSGWASKSWSKAAPATARPLPTPPLPRPAPRSPPIAAAALGDADIVLKVQRPLTDGEAGIDELKHLKRGAVLIGLLQPLQHPADVEAYARAGIVAFAMELVPRITRAQAMDVLSSQANLAGYKAVLDAAAEFGRAFPMMMTAAGTIKAARVLVMGAGVAGLQAIATARRLGAIVSATDVRAAAKEQVESLGATFITVDEAAARSAETAGGYAREMGEDYQRRQRERITEALKRTDIVICTALIPGRKAPVLLTEAMVAELAPGSVVVDLAVEAGGNVEGSRPEEIVTTANGVKIIGHVNMPSRIAGDASQLYARNLLAFLALLVDKDNRDQDRHRGRDHQGDAADRERRGGQPGAARRRRPADAAAPDS